MASRLSSSDIVLGKLLVRMLYVMVLLGVSLPVLSLLVLFGGIDPKLVVVACGATFSTAWFLASLSIWVSTFARRGREALFIAYGLECLWLFSPLVLMTIAKTSWLTVNNAAQWLADWAGASSPVQLGLELVFGFAIGGGPRISEMEIITWMMGLQTLFGLVLAMLAAAQLRPIFRRMDGGAMAGTPRGILSMLRSRSRWRIKRRPVFEDYPVLWKELHTAHTRGFARLIAILLTAIGGGFLAYYTVWYAGLAITEMLEYGPMENVDYGFQLHRRWFGYFVGLVVPVLYVLGILSVAGAAAAGITTEHEEDTWVSLTSTDLTGREIMFAKLIGALRRGRRFAGLALLLAITAVVVGAIDVLSIPLLIVALVVFGWFSASLGLWMSTHLRSTWRAQFLTIASLLLINVTGQVALNAFSKFSYAPQLWPGFTPYEISKTLLEPQFRARLAAANWPPSWSVSYIDNGLPWQTILWVLSIVGYAAFTAVLTLDALRAIRNHGGKSTGKKLEIRNPK
jgi:hypothetical protein